MILFIYLCIFLLNVVAIFLTYHSLGTELEKKQRGLFVIIGIAIMYMAVTLVYWLSTKQIDLGQLASMGQQLITFTFVPVNGIVVLPLIAKSYQSLQLGKLERQHFINRCIALTVILIVILIIEFFYFKEIQNGILQILEANSLRTN